MERTLIIIKPDGVQRGLIGEIIGRFEKKGIKIVGLKYMRLDEALLREHYAHVVDRPFFEAMEKFMKSSPVVIMALEGSQVVRIARMMAGTDSIQMGTIRGDYGLGLKSETPDEHSLPGFYNVVHSSGNKEEAEEEIKRFFGPGEIFEYNKEEWRHVYGKAC